MIENKFNSKALFEMKLNTWIGLFSFITILCASSLNSMAQVTIGSDLPPLAGALLQLKENNNPAANATRGLGLPRVTLTTLDGLNDVGVNPAESEDHVGLLIYSAQENFCGLSYIYEGAHVWSGTKWEYLGKKIEQSSNVFTFTDPRDGEKYRYRDFGPVAGVWMLDDMRAMVYDGLGVPPILSGESQPGGGTRKQYAFPAPSGIGIDDLYYRKQPAIGILYNWPAAINIDPDGVPTSPSINEGEDGTASTEVRQGICPQGWHVPSDMEWNDIESVIAQNPAMSSTNSGTLWDNSWRTLKGIRPDIGENAHGHSMKSHCQPIAAAPEFTTIGKSFLPDTGGFNVLLVGDLLDETLQFFGERVSFWSSSSGDAGAAWVRTFRSLNPGVQRVDNNKARLYSVRCKQD